MKNISPLPAAFAAVLAFSALNRAVADSSDGNSATNQAENLPSVLVIGTRIPTPPENTASPVTVITRDEILATQQRFVADVLRAETGGHRP